MNTFREVEQALAPYVARAAVTIGLDITIDRTTRLAAHIGNPQERLRVVHVAGTSGKTSTCYYLAGLLGAAGQRVGLTVSPHIVSIAERVQIDGQPLDEPVFCAYMQEFLALVEDSEDQPTYYELMLCFALWVFEREGVGYAVVETGLGGLHDSTNICRRDDKLCVLTDIGLDHIEILGATLAEIARQKVGIIAPGNTVVMYEQTPEIMQEVQAACRQQQADIRLAIAPDSADFRERNFALSYQAYQVLAARDGLPELTADQLESVRHIAVPGRLTTVSHGDATIIYDGAHNEQKARALVQTLSKLYPGERFAVVLAMKQGKEYEAAVSVLGQIAKRVAVTKFSVSQDAPIRSVDPALLAQACVAVGLPVQQADSLQAAVDELVMLGETRILVTGSLYAVSELLQ